MSGDKVGCVGQQSFLVVFDFDHTLLECNSDTAIPGHLGISEQQNDLIQQRMQWTNLISKLIGPFTKEQLTDAAQCAVSVHPGVVEMLKFLTSIVQHRKDQPAHVAGEIPPIEVCIASDANTHFIEAIVAQYFPFLTLTSLHTNIFHDLRGTAEETDLLKSKLMWYEPEPGHNCRLCCSRGRPHMCKSRIIHRCLDQSKLIDPTVIFVGDGSNDYCPVLNCLRPRDHVFARLDFPLSKDLSIQGGGCCHIRVWKNGDDLGKLFEQVLIKAQYRLPTVVRFGDWSSQEFRYRTLVKRVPHVIRSVVAENQGKLSSTAVGALTKLAETFEDPHGKVMPLPGHNVLPQWLQNYASARTFLGRQADAQADDVEWSQIPWLHGEIYVYHLINLLAHLADDLTSASAHHTSGHLLVSPTALCSPLVQMEDRDVCVERQRMLSVPKCAETTVEDEVDHPAHRTAQAAAPDHQFFDPSFLARATKATFVTPTFDIFKYSKDKMMKEMLSPRIVPTLRTRLWSQADGLNDILLGMLWGNSVDLSMLQDNREQKLKTMQGSFPPSERILANDLAPLAQYILMLSQSSTTAHIDIILDNAGVELTEDLCLVAWILTNSTGLCVTLHAKSMPFYVSDTTFEDVTGLFSALRSTDEPACVEFVNILEHHWHVTKRLRLHNDACWVAPLEYRDLPPQVVNAFFFAQRLKLPEPFDPDALHPPTMPFPQSQDRFPKSSLVIFKGDLNFRRLVGDRHWDQRSFFASSPLLDGGANGDFDALTAYSKGARAAPTLREAIEDFWPVDAVPVAALRTLKSELTAGVSLETVDSLDGDSTTRGSWRISGEYAVALFTGGCS